MMDSMGTMWLVKRTTKAELIDLLAELVDPDRCSYDHHGYCQAHGLDPMPCPHERAKRLIKAKAEHHA